MGVPNLKVALVVAGMAAGIGGAAVAKLTGRSMLLGGLRQFTAAFLGNRRGLPDGPPDRRPRRLAKGQREASSTGADVVKTWRRMHEEAVM